jgi:branched-chain amino acid transport system ATP-binding protein
MPLLTVSDLNVRYGKIQGTSGVSFEVETGETLALIGSNGAGKSSTLRAIMGLVQYPEGDITFEGQSLKGMKASRIVQLGIGLSPEGRRVFPDLTVVENLKIGSFTRASDEFAERAEQIFDYFPRLRERATQRAGLMSGGEQQMLAIGRALMPRPKLFLLDEPSLGLAPIIVESIGEILTDIQKKEGLSVVLAEQNAVWSMRIAARAAILELGKISMTGDTEDLREDPRVRSAFLGI